MNTGKLVKTVFTFGGLGLICFGLWQYEPPIAYISAGVGLFLIGLGWI